MSDRPEPIDDDTKPTAEDGLPASEEAPKDAEVSDPEERIRELEANLRARDEDLLRERAEVENFKRRTNRDKAEAIRFASEPLIRELLPVVDNLERALEHAEAAGEAGAVVDGVRLVHKGLVDALTRHGVARVEALGEPFDPSAHEAIAQASSDDHAPGAVVQQHQVGYRLHDRLLRPAMVSVNARKAEEPVARDPNRD